MNILLADDHLMCLDGYIAALNNPSNSYTLAYTCEEVYRLLAQGVVPDVAVLDHDMKSFEEKKLRSGIDCAKYIRKHIPTCKIIMITAHEDAVLLYNIRRQGVLDALLVKCDFTHHLLINLVVHTIEEPYYSESAKKAFKQLTRISTLLESKNREILTYLAAGFKVSQLDDLVNLSQSAIKRRIGKMLQEFNVTDNQELVRLAREQNLF
ncbi:response regulator [Myroides pelagicus]|uniref:Response regulator n=1 Tax=Myroides pelagicus TaxID=270914 RepID=A0A7K1GQ23_9FLAO|nr:response regulator [Myroides pelagicus]MTH31012.1 response regulator [Myroides pelagicus]